MSYVRKLVEMPLTLSDWIAYGVRQGWCSEPVCDTHDELPVTRDEEEELDAGFDPCIPIIRLFINEVADEESAERN